MVHGGYAESGVVYTLLHIPQWYVQHGRLLPIHHNMCITQSLFLQCIYNDYIFIYTEYANYVEANSVACKVDRNKTTVEF